MSSISQFLTALKNGGARPNRFEVYINFPSFAGTADDIRKTPFLISSSQLPGSNLGVIEQPFRGRMVKLAGDRVFDDFECTFVNDANMEIRNAFERWHNAINSYNSNTGTGVPEDYFATVTVYQLDTQDNRVKEYTLKYAWPSVVGQVDLAQDSSNVLEIFTVTFSYSDLDNGQST